MPRPDRIALIERIEKARGSRVISVFLGDRPGAETRIAPDLLPRVARYLREIGKVPSIDIFLYSTGGEIMSGYRVVSLVREYCKKFSVLVPSRCQSTATLLALGANEIVMLPEGQLSPVDPSINGPFNPMIPGAPLQPGKPLPLLPVSVEEVVSYVKLAQEVAGLKSEAWPRHSSG
jgi:Periplasmic serine proteases (ClpP class)